MKTIILTLLCTCLFSTFAMASGVSDCNEDSYTSERILNEIPAEERVYVYKSNKKVGAIHTYNNKLVSIYLCGDNPTYYYADGLLSDLKTGQSIFIYNDEYSFEVKKTTFSNNRVRVLFSVFSDGAMDYENFKDYFELIK